MTKDLRKMKENDSDARRDRKRDRDGWKANLAKARKDKAKRRDAEQGESA